MFCREHVVQVHRQIDRIRSRGAEVVVIGNGTPSFIAGFREETGWDGPLYTDPSRKVYEAAELVRGVLATLHPAAALRVVGALRRGFRQGRTQGDPWQQGGVLVIAPGADKSRILWHQASSGPGDNAEVDDIVAALG